MRAEFVAVWEDTYREIWAPLTEQEGVPADLFSQLYLELASAFKAPSDEEARALVLNDPIQVREAFSHSLALAGIDLDFATAEEVFENSNVASESDSSQRRIALEAALAALVGEAESENLLSRAIGELAGDPDRQAEAKSRSLQAIVNDAKVSRVAFERVRSVDLRGERALTAFLETAFDIVEDIGGDALSNSYFNLLTAFTEKFSLRYDLRRPCLLCPTVPGVFASLVRDLRTLTKVDAHLDGLMREFENAVRDLRDDCSDGRLKTCIQKQVNLLEALGSSYPGVTATELGGMCNQIATWPHAAIKASLKNLYGFASDYPGIRHGGNPESALRAVDLRDVLALSILLTGFTPYLSSGLDAEVFYRGE
jgi:hypothetical protein